MANGRLWTRYEIYKLLEFSVQMSQAQAARRLGRSKTAVASKVRAMGIRWRKSVTSYFAIAKEVGCSPQTVQRMAHILLHDEVPTHKGAKKNGLRALLSYEDAQRIKSVLLKSRKVRKQNIEAGRKSARMRAKKAKPKKEDA